MFEVDSLLHPPFHVRDNGEHFTTAKRFFWIGIMDDCEAAVRDEGVLSFNVTACLPFVGSIGTPFPSPDTGVLLIASETAVSQI